MLIELLLLAGVSAGAVVLGARAASENRRAILSRILGRIEDGKIDEARSTLWRDVVTGEHQERPFVLSVGTRRRYVPRPRLMRQVDEVYPLELELELRHAPDVRLRIRQDRGLAATEKALGLVTDVEVARGGAFDQRFLVEVSGDAAGAPLASGAVRREVERLLVTWALDEVAIRDGKLVIHGTPETLGRKELHRLLDAVEVLAHAFDRRPAIEIGLAERFAWVGGVDQLPRCPFCHDLVERGPDLASCETCKTLIHAECHQENGGCPILGCGGRRAQLGGGRDSKATGDLDLA